MVCTGMLRRIATTAAAADDDEGLVTFFRRTFFRRDVAVSRPARTLHELARSGRARSSPFGA